MAAIGLIALCLGLGALLRCARRLPQGTPAVLNAFIFHVALPAATLASLPALRPRAELFLPAAMAWIVYCGALIYVRVVGRMAGWDRATLGALTLTAGLGNTSFVGFPLLQALLGPQALAVGILNDQPGTFLAFSTVGILTASAYAGKASRGFDWKRLFTFPPFVVMLLTLALAAAGVSLPAALQEICERLAATLIPLALVSVGFQIRFRLVDLWQYGTRLFAGLFYKLALAPALILLLYVWIGGWHGEMVRITVLEAAMAPMVTAAVLADESGLEPELANLMLAVGIPLSLLTVPLWLRLTEFLAGSPA